VNWIAGCCRSLAEAHLLTGKPEYANACRAILLRFADCYPAWLVHVGYGEYADMDPRVAALNINQLPDPELCPPPNRADRRLHTGYWSAGRAGGVGMESGFVRQVVEAYDWTCAAWNVGQPGERAWVADGWGQRDWKNSDIGATIPYIVRRCEGDGAQTFISVFEGYEDGEPLVRGVTLVDPSGTLCIETTVGKDYVMSMLDAGTLEVPTSAGQPRIAAHFAVMSVRDQKLAWMFAQETVP